MMTVTRPRLRVDSAIADRDRPDGPPAAGGKLPLADRARYPAPYPTLTPPARLPPSPGKATSPLILPLPPPALITGKAHFMGKIPSIKNY